MAEILRAAPGGCRIPTTSWLATFDRPGSHNCSFSEPVQSAKSGKIRPANSKREIPMDAGEILDQLTHAEGLPKAALQAASAQRAEMVPVFLREIDSYLALAP